VIEDFGAAGEICSFAQEGAKIGDKVPCQEPGFQNPSPTRTLTAVVFGVGEVSETPDSTVSGMASMPAVSSQQGGLPSSLSSFPSDLASSSTGSSSMGLTSGPVSHSVPGSVIAGAIVGGLLGLVIVLITAYCIYRRPRSTGSQGYVAIPEPFVSTRPPFDSFRNTRTDQRPSPLDSHHDVIPLVPMARSEHPAFRWRRHPGGSAVDGKESINAGSSSASGAPLSFFFRPYSTD
jgi:hypothetical protein